MSLLTKLKKGAEGLAVAGFLGVVGGAIGLSYNGIESLNKKLLQAKHEDGIWKTNEDISIHESRLIRDKLTGILHGLEERAAAYNPEVYFTLAKAKL